MRTTTHSPPSLRLGRAQPDSVVSDLVTNLRARHQLVGENFARDRTFAAGASCLLRLMDEREQAFRQKVERDAA